MTAPTLTDFLLARIADDEQQAGRSVQIGDKGAALISFGKPDAPPVLVIHPARVLAECEAKRQIVTREPSVCGGLWDEGDADKFEQDYGWRPAQHYPREYVDGCDGCAAAETADHDHAWVLKALAQIYADHPDYRDEWRP